MKIFDYFKKSPQPAAEKPKASSQVPKSKKLSEKEIATQKGEPWVNVVGFDLDPANMSNGSIELDFNDVFVARLVKAGYRGKDDHQIVDQWFTDVCRNIVLETFEQEQADPEKRSSSTIRKNLGNGRSEFS